MWLQQPLDLAGKPGDLIFIMMIKMTIIMIIILMIIRMVKMMVMLMTMINFMMNFMRMVANIVPDGAYNGSMMLVVIMMMRASRSIFYCRTDIPHGRSEQLDVCGLLRMREVGCSLIIPQVLDVCGLREVLLRGEACATGLMLRSER